MLTDEAAPTITFNPKLDPVLLSPKKAGRYAADNCTQLVTYKDRQFLAATNGRALTMIACQATDLPELGTRLPRAMIAHARKTTAKGKDATISIEGETASAYGLTLPRLDHSGAAVFPDVIAVIPKVATKVRVGLNADLLAQIQKAIGAGSIVLEIPADAMHEVDGVLVANGAIRVQKGIPGKTDCVEGSFGVIMPVSG